MVTVPGVPYVVGTWPWQIGVCRLLEEGGVGSTPMTCKRGLSPGSENNTMGETD